MRYMQHVRTLLHSIPSIPCFIHPSHQLVSPVPSTPFSNSLIQALSISATTHNHHLHLRSSNLGLRRTRRPVQHPLAPHFPPLLSHQLMMRSVRFCCSYVCVRAYLSFHVSFLQGKESSGRCKSKSVVYSWFRDFMIS